MAHYKSANGLSLKYISESFNESEGEGVLQVDYGLIFLVHYFIWVSMGKKWNSQ